MTSKDRLVAECGDEVDVKRLGDLWEVRLFPNNQPSTCLGMGATEDEAWAQASDYYFGVFG